MSARSKQGKGKGAGKRNPNSAGDTSPHSEVQSDASPQTTSRGEPDVPTPDVGVTPVSGVTPRQDPDGEAEPREFNEAPDEAVPVSKSIYNEVMATPSENSVSFPADARSGWNHPVLRSWSESKPTA